MAYIGIYEWSKIPLSDDNALIVYGKVLLAWMTEFHFLCILLILLLWNILSFLSTSKFLRDQHHNIFDISSFIYKLFHDVSSSDCIYIYIYIYIKQQND